MPTRVITKALAVEEDLQLGKGIIQQVRGGATLDLHQISVAKVISNVAVFGNDTTFDEHVDPSLYECVKVEGYDTKDDEGGGIFVWDDTINPLSADGGQIFASGITTVAGAWRRMEDDKFLNVKHYGAKGDGVTDDTAAFQRVEAAAIDRVKATIYIPEGVYNIDSTMDLTALDTVIVIGDGQQNSIINYVGNAGPLFRVDTGGETDEAAQFVIMRDFTARTNRADLTCIYLTSSAILGDITRSAYFSRITFIGETSNDGWNFCIHTQDVRGVTVKDCYARHVMGSIGTIFFNIDNTIAFDSDTYTAWNNECHYYENKYGAVTPTGACDCPLNIPDDTITVDMIADAPAGSILTWDATDNAILLPPGSAGEFLQTQGPGLPPVWAAAGGGGGFDIDSLPAAVAVASDIFAFSGGSVGGTESQMTFTQLNTLLDSIGVPAGGSVKKIQTTTLGAPAGTAVLNGFSNLYQAYLIVLEDIRFNGAGSAVDVRVQYRNTNGVLVPMRNTALQMNGGGTFTDTSVSTTVIGWSPINGSGCMNGMFLISGNDANMASDSEGASHFGFTAPSGNSPAFDNRFLHVGGTGNAGGGQPCNIGSATYSCSSGIFNQGTWILYGIE